MSWTLCIDFGTAYSKAAAAPSDAWSRFEPGSIRPLMLGGQGAGNPFLLESAVFVDDDRLLFGPAAVARAEALSESKRAALRSFKTLLGVSDLERALNTGVPASIDPPRLFSMGDLIMLYLAYFNAAIERAVAADPLLAAVRGFDRRYAAPAWRTGDSAGLHGVVMRLFGQAEALQDALQDALGPTALSSDGIAIEQAREALSTARASTRLSSMGLIFEATAAGAYTSVGLEADAPALIVLDMGAGTTDIAVLARAGARVEELADARVTMKQAGDYIDRVIANLVVAANPRIKAVADQGRLWRLAMGAMRDLKETLFIEGRAGFRHDGRVTQITMRALEKDRDFRAFKAGLEHAYNRGLEVARDYAALHGRREIQAVAVGGGAAAPFIQQLVRAKPRNAGKLQITPRPATPDWAHAREFRGNLAPVFPQLAIAIGGAIAPETMLAAPGGGFSLAVDAQTGNPAGRD
jgi:molecular chaperone DnaK (HSP70)